MDYQRNIKRNVTQGLNNFEIKGDIGKEQFQPFRKCTSNIGLTITKTNL